MKTITKSSIFFLFITLCLGLTNSLIAKEQIKSIDETSKDNMQTVRQKITSLTNGDVKIERKRQQLGIRFSNLTGYGLSYQNRLTTNFAVRTTAWFKSYEYRRGPEKDPLYSSSNNVMSAGFDIQRNIINSNKYRVFAFIGVGYQKIEKVDYDKLDTTIGAKSKIQELTTGGVGCGTEYFFNNHLSADFGLSYKYDYDKKDFINDDELDDLRKETGLGIMVGINLNY